MVEKVSDRTSREFEVPDLIGKEDSAAPITSSSAMVVVDFQNQQDLYIIISLSI